MFYLLSVSLGFFSLSYYLYYMYISDGGAGSGGCTGAIVVRYLWPSDVSKGVGERVAPLFRMRTASYECAYARKKKKEDAAHIYTYNSV